MDLFDSDEPVFFDYPLSGGIIKICKSFYDVASANAIFNDLMGEVDWDQEEINIYGKTSPLPRLTSWHGQNGMNYKYSGIFSKAKPFTRTLEIVKLEIERAVRAEFNSVLLNLYRNGGDSISWHSDDERELGVAPVIASLSLGETRKFKFKNKTTGEVIDLLLENGDLLVMSGETQRNWLHHIPKSKSVSGMRINLTFRYIFK